jgi:hypothetical protein
MTSATARTTANVVLASAAIAAAYVIVTTPPLRLLAACATERWLGTNLPDYLVKETRRAWLDGVRAGGLT